MATVKQLKMLAARAKQVGMEWDFDSCKDLDNGDIDKKLEEIASYNPPKEKPLREKEVRKVEEINGARFGMVYKIVTERVGVYWKQQDKEAFIKRVVDEYNLATEAEAAVAASSSSFYDQECVKISMAHLEEEITRAVEQPNSCKIAVNAKGLWSGEIKVYAENIDEAVNTANVHAARLSEKIRNINGLTKPGVK